MNIKTICLLGYCSSALNAISQEPKLDYALGTTAQNRSLTEDAEGNVYVAGYFTGTCDFDPGDGTYELSAFAREDVFVTKLSQQGDFLWAVQLESSGGCAIGNNGTSTSGIALDDQGNIVVSGWFNCIMDFDPGPDQLFLDPAGIAAFVVKLNSMGELLWAKRFGQGANAYPYALLVRGDEIITVGTFNGTADYDPGPGSFNVSGQFEGFVNRLDQNGDFVSVWILDRLTGGGIYPRAVSSVGVNDIIVAGYFNGTFDLDPSATTNWVSTAGGFDGFVCRFTGTGQLEWGQHLGGTGNDHISTIAVDTNDDIVLSGQFESTVDFDQGPAVYNLTSAGGGNIFISRLTSAGNLIWAGSLESTNGSQYAYGMDVDDFGNIYVIGMFAGMTDFDLGYGAYPLENGGSWGFIGKWDASGKVIWANPIGGTGYGIHVRLNGGVLSCGEFGFPIDFDPGEGEYFLQLPVGSYLWALKEGGVLGSVWNDIVPDCNESFYEPGLEGRIIEIQPGGILAQTNSRGFWYIDSLPPGNYTATVDQHRGPWESLCSASHPFEVTNTEGDVSVEPFGLNSTQPCAAPEVSVFAPIVRRCMGAQPLHVSACNQLIGSAIMPEAYVEVELDSMWSVMSATMPYSTIAQNRFRFEIGDLWPGQCVTIILGVDVDCGAELGATLCGSAELFPVVPCMLDTVTGPGDCTTAWDGSSLKVDSYCLDDTVRFTIRNVAAFGIGDMTCYSHVRVYLDGVLIQVDSVLLMGGESFTFAFPGNGQTWRLEADQHPLHPGNSRPMSVQERCGSPENWTPGLVNRQYMNDADPIIDVFCEQVNGSFDPNDKTGYPLGLTDANYIDAGQQLQYVIRFQNTGNDTAFTVVLRDTLSVLLDALSFVPGVASHPYTLRMYGPRVVEWTFENILLPDSTTDVLGSSGFVTFRIDPVGGLADGSTIRNAAAIYFDFNEPVVTAPTIHVIHDLNDISLSDSAPRSAAQLELAVFPNPTQDGGVVVALPPHDYQGVLSVHDAYGRMLDRISVPPQLRSIPIELKAASAGLYFIQFTSGTLRHSVRLIRH